MNKQAEYQRRYEEIVALSMLDETEAEYVVNEANRIARKASELDLPQPIKTALFFTASSIALNFACGSDDSEADDPLHLLEHSLQEPDDADADQAQSDGRDTD